MTKQTKAQRLFSAALREAKRAISFYGVGVIDCVSLYDREDDVICQRTVNAIRREAERRLRTIDVNERYGIDYGDFTFDEQREAVRVVLNSCDSWERDNRAFLAELRAL